MNNNSLWNEFFFGWLIEFSAPVECLYLAIVIVVVVVCKKLVWGCIKFLVTFCCLYKWVIGTIWIKWKWVFEIQFAIQKEILLVFKKLIMQMPMRYMGSSKSNRPKNLTLKWFLGFKFVLYKIWDKTNFFWKKLEWNLNWFYKNKLIYNSKF